MSFWIALAVTLAAELYVLRRLRFDTFTVALVLASTLLCAHYLGYTSFEERNYDGFSHLEYIQALARTGRLPPADACGACGHPPLYYALGALWSVGLPAAVPLERGLQWLSLASFFGYVVFALIIFRSCGAGPRTLRLAAALVAFWPSSIINSVRLHNDSLASPLMLAAMYFTARYYERARPAHFHLALGTSALALLTKATGFTVATALVLFTALRPLAAQPLRERIKQCATVVFVLAAVAALAVEVRDFRSPRAACQQVLGTACDGRYVPPVPDRPGRFVSFDVADFVLRMDTTPKAPERDYFLNRLAKSSLLGVTPLGDELGTARHRALSAVMSLLLLGMVGSCVAGVVLFRGAVWRPRYRVYVGTSALMLAFLVAFRLRAPNPFHEDFRHIFPVLVPFCLGYATVVERAGHGSKVLRWGGLAVGALMVLSSVAFFVRLP
jgi:hypothetical protein